MNVDKKSEPKWKEENTRTLTITLDNILEHLRKEGHIKKEELREFAIVKTPWSRVSGKGILEEEEGHLSFLEDYLVEITIKKEDQ